MDLGVQTFVVLSDHLFISFAWRFRTHAVSPKMGFVPPASRPVRKVCMRIFPGVVLELQSVYVWYFISSISGSVAKGGSELKKDFRGCENREATSAWFSIGCQHRSVGHKEGHRLEWNSLVEYYRELAQRRW